MFKDIQADFLTRDSINTYRFLYKNPVPKGKKTDSSNHNENNPVDQDGPSTRVHIVDGLVLPMQLFVPLGIVDFATFLKRLVNMYFSPFIYPVLVARPRGPFHAVIIAQTIVPPLLGSNGNINEVTRTR